MFAKRTDRFAKIAAPRMAQNSPVNALVVFDGWMGGGSGLSHDQFVKMSNELEMGDVYSVAEVLMIDGRTKVRLNEVGGVWDTSYFAAHK